MMQAFRAELLALVKRTRALVVLQLLPPKEIEFVILASESVSSAFNEPTLLASSSNSSSLFSLLNISHSNIYLF